MINDAKVAIVAALEREVRFLIKSWRSCEREYDGHTFRFFEDGLTVLVCGGIGAEASRRAAEAIITFYHPVEIQSVGFAGALDETMRAGSVLLPHYVIDARDGSKTEIARGQGTLLTVPAIAGVSQKQKFAAAYGAQAIDMEASSVARAARAHGIAFTAVKSISDEDDFELPVMDLFVDHHGRFRTTAFAIFIGLRPWNWAKAAKLAKNSSIAARSLCGWLQGQQAAQKLDNSASRAHPIEGEHSQPTVR